MNSNLIKELLGDVKRGWSLPRSFYISEEVFENDLQQIYFQYWLYAGHTSQIPAKGDYFTFDIAGESIIIIHGRDNVLRAFYNVCPHRGSRICLNESGNTKVLVCPYHQWSFNPSGELLASREMGEDFEKHEYRLRRIHLQVMEGMIFISLAEKKPSFDCMVSDVLPQLRIVGMTKAKIAFSKTYDVHANWKLIVENFRECYHCHVGHPEYIRAVEGISKSDPEHVTSCLDRWMSMGVEVKAVPFASETWHHCQRYPFHKGFVTESIDGTPVAPLMGGYTDFDMGTFCIVTYPNFWFESSSDHAVIIRHIPVSASLTRITMTWFVNGHAQEGKDYDIDKLIAFWKITAEQDWELCSNNHLGVQSKAYRQGPYGAEETEIIKFHDWYLDNIRLAIQTLE